ncbi:transporter [Burkholderia pseudomallei]|nr:transporter [Burkholderia pseudomallei]
MYRQWLSSLFLAAAVPARVSMAGIGATARPGFAGAGEAFGARGAAAAGE